MFLKRCPYTGLTSMDDFFIGAVLTVYGRQLKINDYGDVATRKRFEVDRQRTFAMIKPDAYRNIGKIIDAIYVNGFKINKLKMSRFSYESSQVFYGEHVGKSFFPNLQKFITSDVVVGMELVAESAIDKWRGLIGPTNTQKAKSDAPESLRALFGTDGTQNAVHGSDSPQSVKREIGYWFEGDFKSKAMKTTAQLNNCTLCIIKPHIVQAGQAGIIIDMILNEGFEISALEMFYLNRPTIEEFYDAYKTVLPEYMPQIEHFISGPSIVLEIRQQNVVKTFREMVGPCDPEIAKYLRPETIRAKFGLDRVRNAVHCTDLPEDGTLECEYFFNILQKYQ